MCDSFACNFFLLAEKAPADLPPQLMSQKPPLVQLKQRVSFLIPVHLSIHPPDSPVFHKVFLNNLMFTSCQLVICSIFCAPTFS